MAKVIKKSSGAVGKVRKPVNLVKIVHDVSVLHAEIGTAINTAMQKAIVVGELLSEAKKEVGYGKWQNWVEVNLPITPRQSGKYIRLYNEREDIPKLGNNGIDKTIALLASEASDEDVDSAVDADKAEVISERLKQAEKAVEQFEKERKKLIEKLEDARASDEDLSENIEKLKKKRDNLLDTIHGFKSMENIISKSRDFFAKNLAIIPTLKMTPRAIKAVRGDVEALVGLVEDWTALMRDKFDV